MKMIVEDRNAFACLSPCAKRRCFLSCQGYGGRPARTAKTGLVGRPESKKGLFYQVHSGVLG